MRQWTHEETLAIGVHLENYHRCFFVFFEMARITFDETILTAAVFFSVDHQPQIKINEAFWNTLNTDEQVFIICHECLHVILDHSRRSGKTVPGATRDLVNIAQDITINEMIVDRFNFDRTNLRNWQNYCWIDTCFKDPLTILRNETFIYYLEKLIDNSNMNDFSRSQVQLVDDHSQHDSIVENHKASSQRVIEELIETMEPAILEKILRSTPPGSTRNAIELSIYEKIKPVKIKFKRIIKELKRTRTKYHSTTVESFAHEGRRFTEMIAGCQSLVLPGTTEQLRPKRARLQTAVFMDVSGSCIKHVNVFMNVAKAFELQKEFFDTWLYTFDTEVKRVFPKDRILGGGGTSFSIIETECLNIQSVTKRYPDCVIVITDGAGTTVNPAVPKNWVWLLTPNPDQQYVSSQSKSFLISEISFS